MHRYMYQKHEPQDSELRHWITHGIHIIPTLSTSLSVNSSAIFSQTSHHHIHFHFHFHLHFHFHVPRLLDETLYWLCAQDQNKFAGNRLQIVVSTPAQTRRHRGCTQR